MKKKKKRISTHTVHHTQKISFRLWYFHVKGKTIMFLQENTEKYPDDFRLVIISLTRHKGKG